MAISLIGLLSTTSLGTLTIFGVSASKFLAYAAMQLAINALTPKPKAVSGYQVTSKGSALDRQVIYGKTKVYPVVVFDTTTGVNNKVLHRVLAYAGHEIDSFERIYINDSYIEVSSIGPDGNVGTVIDADGNSSTRYNGNLKLFFHLGSPDQTVDSNLMSEVAEWTTDHRLRGIAYIYARFTFSQDAYPNGIPEISAVIKGKKVYDPRSATTAWSDNPALCIRDYLTDTAYGLGEDTVNIDDTLVATAANVCEFYNYPTLTGGARFTCNGAFTTGSEPYDILNTLASSMGGMLWYAQGKWRMKPAHWTSPVIDLNEDDLRSGITISTRHSRRDNFNTVNGIFRGEESNWQETDFPPVTNQAFIEADNGEKKSVDIKLPFTSDSVIARRIALIYLERNRQQLTVQASFGMRAFQVQVGDIVTLTNTRFGWSAKEFEVISWTFSVSQEQGIVVQMALREIAESVFDDVSDGIVYERDNTTLLSPFLVPSVGISAVAVSRVLAEKLLNGIDITVSSSQASLVDRVEVFYKKSSDSAWTSVGTGDLGVFEVLDAEKAQYDFRARAINSFGVRGEFTVLTNQTIDASDGPPEDVASLNAEVVGNTLTLSWPAVPNLDLSHYKIRHSVEDVGASWSNGTTAVEKVARPGVEVSLPLRAGTYHIKAIDKGGLQSENYTSVVIPSSYLPSYATTLTQTEGPSFSGVKTGVSVVSNALRLTPTVSAGSTGTYEFSNYIDTGSVRLVWARVEAAVTRVDDTGGSFDELPGLLDDLPGLFDSLGSNAEFADMNVKFYISTTDDDPAGTPTWSDWKQFRAGNFSGRAFKFKIELLTESANITPNITSLDAIVEY